MSRRPWYDKFRFALAISILVHLLLALGLWRLSWEGPPATLTEAGGVTWLNLDPGGAGTGGDGGHGAPAEAELGAGTAPPALPEEADRPASTEVQPPKPEKEGTLPAVRQVEKTATETGIAEQVRPPKKSIPKSPPPKATKPKPQARKTENEPAAGRRGPGEGDGTGPGSGPGGGKGKGLGEGEGSGTGSGRGPGGSGALGSGGSGQGGEANAILAKIRDKIARAKRYPRQARSEGLEGVCGLQFAIRPDGSLEYVRLNKSSGYGVLDDEALATVRRAAPFPYYEGPIRFSLRFSLRDL